MIIWAERNIFTIMKSFSLLSICFLICLTSCKSDKTVESVAELMETAEETVIETVDTLSILETRSLSEEPEENEIEEPVNEEVNATDLTSSEENKAQNGAAKKSTIAMQQEAARKIIEQENRKKAAKASGEEKATFKKVISKQSDIEAKPNAQEKPTTKKAKPQLPKVKKSKSGAKIEFDEMTMSFDTIQAGDIVNHSFYFTNTGSGPLVINQATATCGCTQPSYPFVPIEPNEKGHISVRYNSVNKAGVQKPTITVFSNAGKEIQLTMEGYVVEKETEEKDAKEGN